jgi:hypothetical protein
MKYRNLYPHVDVDVMVMNTEYIITIVWYLYIL